MCWRVLNLLPWKCFRARRGGTARRTARQARRTRAGPLPSFLPLLCTATRSCSGEPSATCAGSRWSISPTTENGVRIWKSCHLCRHKTDSVDFQIHMDDALCLVAKETYCAKFETRELLKVWNYKENIAPSVLQGHDFLKMKNEFIPSVVQRHY